MNKRASIANQRLIKQLWISIALASLLPIFVTLYLVSSLWDARKPSVAEVGTMLALAVLFSALGSYLIFTIWQRFKAISERALRASALTLPSPPGLAEVGDDFGQLDTAIDRFTQQLRASMEEVQQKALELSAAKKQLELANQKLQRLDEMKSEFLRFISHEFRSPLMCVQMSLSSLLEEPEQPLASDQEKYVDVALRNSQRLLRLINQMIDLTKIRHARPSQEKQVVELLPLIQRLLGELKETIERNEIQVHTHGHGGKLAVLTDPESTEVALRHVLTNMVENTPPHGRADLIFHSTGSEVQLTVGDSGPPIVERPFGNLFVGLIRRYEENDPRWRNDVFGLTLAKEIIGLNGGTLELLNGSARRGHLTIRLPRGKQS